MKEITSGESANIITKNKTYLTLPSGQVNLAALNLRIASAWQTNQTTATFGFVTYSDFVTQATQFDTDIRKKREKLAARKILTAEMTDTMNSVFGNLRHLKAYIVEKYGLETAKSHFADFGIVLRRGHYEFPKDRDELLVSLAQTLNALNANPDIAVRTYGLSYWSDLKNKLSAQWNEAAILDGNLATLTAALQTQTASIKKMVTRMKNQIKLDNADNHKQIWRAWGLQQEKL